MLVCHAYLPACISSSSSSSSSPMFDRYDVPTLSCDAVHPASAIRPWYTCDAIRQRHDIAWCLDSWCTIHIPVPPHLGGLERWLGSSWNREPCRSCRVWLVYGGELSCCREYVYWIAIERRNLYSRADFCFVSLGELVVESLWLFDGTILIGPL